uniref:microfibril-associated glycoprotein 4-like n=1 Tax=Ciona intestinalis TaxID=7719 RepID=UPI000EF49B8D|nr:microfibril-associated glycoprotein 4-like [Ciona intestinalis]|eukprot:XP_026692205.1 microfibril-associated glycoprotein 4-like [Ciona intestinalis]
MLYLIILSKVISVVYATTSVTSGAYKGYQASVSQIHHIPFHTCFSTPPICVEAALAEASTGDVQVTDVNSSGFTARVNATANRNLVVDWTVHVALIEQFSDCESATALAQKSGRYYLLLGDNCAFELVYCDVTAVTEGWTVIHRRFDGKVNFRRPRIDYLNGFGNKDGEFWLGLRRIKELVDQGNYEMEVRVVDVDGVDHVTRFTMFKFIAIADIDVELYSIYLERTENGVTHRKATSRFVTYDSDAQNIASSLGAWWLGFSEPTGGNLNAINYTQMRWRGVEGPLKEATMLIRKAVTPSITPVITPVIAPGVIAPAIAPVIEPERLN